MDEGRNDAIAVEPILRRQEGVAVDAALSPSELALFDVVGRRRGFDAGERLFARGDKGRTMFVILAGRVELDFGGDLARKTLGPGEFFGELGLLIGDHVRSAGARVLADTEMVELGADELESLLDRDPRMVAQFLHRAITRIVRNEQVLTHRLRRHNHELQDALDRLRAASSTKGAASGTTPAACSAARNCSPRRASATRWAGTSRRSARSARRSTGTTSTCASRWPTRTP